MISEITGELRGIDDDRIQLACGPVVYEILVPAGELVGLQARLNQQVTLHTIFDLEGDASRGGLTPRLIGFLSPHDKRFFQLFITVKGIGPKRALRALIHSTGQVAEAIEARNARFLVGLPEIGKRMAEQIIAELAGKAAPFVLAGAAPGPAARPGLEQDAIEGAMALGIARPEAERLLDLARQSEPRPSTAESLLREMLRLRGGR